MGDFVVQGSKVFLPKLVVGGPTAAPTGPGTVDWSTASAAGTFIQSPEGNGAELTGRFVGDSGFTVDPSGTQWFVGYRKGNTGNGQVEVLRRSGGSPYTLTNTETFDRPQATGNAFGIAVDVSDDLSVLAIAQLTDGAVPGGRGYIYEGSGDPVSYGSPVTSFVSGISTYNSAGVSADGSTVFFGDRTNDGQIDVFRKSGTWTQVDTLTQPLGGTAERMGANGDISGDGSTILASGSSISALSEIYVFVEGPTNSWTETQTITGANDFGQWIQVTPDATRFATTDDNQGYVYIRSGSTYSQEDTLPLSGGGSGDLSASITDDGKFAAIGDPNDSSSNGRVVIFERTGSTWTEIESISGPATGGRFGANLMFTGDGTGLIISEPLYDGVETDSGRVHFYKPNIT